MKNQELIKKAIVDTIPVMTGYLVLGIGFGIFSAKSGYGFPWVLAMSLFVYAGSMQFVLVSLLTGGASVLTTALTTLMVNARHLFYGISMIDRYKDAGPRKPYMIFALTDETYSLVCRDIPEGIDRNKYCFLVSLFDQIYWVSGTCLGALAGSLMTFNTTGIEFSMTALFVTVFVEQWLSTKDHLPAVAGVVLSVVSLVIFGRDNFLIPAMIAIALVLLGKRTLERRSA